MSYDRDKLVWSFQGVRKTTRFKTVNKRQLQTINNKV